VFAKNKQTISSQDLDRTKSLADIIKVGA